MKDWNDPERVGKIITAIMDKLAKEFHRLSNLPEEEKNHDLIIKLSQAVGYQAQTFTSLQKAHEFARRLQSLERSLENVDPETVAMRDNPVIFEEEKEKQREADR